LGGHWDLGGYNLTGVGNITGSDLDISAGTGDYTSTGTLGAGAITGTSLALGAGNLTMSGSIGVTGTRVTKGWFTDLEVTNAIAGSITGNAGTLTVADTADATCYVGLWESASGSLAGKTDAGLLYDASTSTLSGLDLNISAGIGDYTSTGTINTLFIEGIATDNIRIGDAETLSSLSGGQANLAIGANALQAITSNSNCVAVGQNAGRYSTGSNNMAIGRAAIQGVNGSTSGEGNVAIGDAALLLLQGGATNVAIGKSALSHTSSGSNNMGIGSDALLANTTGSQNVAVGNRSLRGVVVGSSNNVAIGHGAGEKLTGSSSDGNMFLGYQSGYWQTAASGIFIVDNQRRPNVAGEIIYPLMYGIMNAQNVDDPTLQSLRINGEILGSVGAKIGDGGTTNYTQISATGVQTMAGTARVTKYAWINAGAIKAAGIKPATSTVNGNGFSVLSFADGQEQYVQANIRIPDDIDLTAVSYICIGWSSPIISQDCDWNTIHLLTAANDDTDQAGTATQDYVESSSTADGLVITRMVTLAADSINSDEICIHLQLWRDGNDGSDNLGAVAELHGIVFEYTSNKLGEAL